MSDETEKRFKDERARAILARAIEIDVHGPMTSVDDLRALASEVGVSPAALEAALREEASLASRQATMHRRSASLVAAAGVPIGLVAGSLLALGNGQSVISLIGPGLVALLASAGLVALQGATGTLRSFHLKNFALWGGVAAGTLVSIALTDGELTRFSVLLTAGWCLRQWVTSSILGSAAVVAVRRARRPDDPGADPGGAMPSDPVREGRWTALAKRARAWLAGSPWRESSRTPAGRGLHAA
jgi:hypothetical protein